MSIAFNIIILNNRLFYENTTKSLPNAKRAFNITTPNRLYIMLYVWLSLTFYYFRSTMLLCYHVDLPNITIIKLK